VIVEMLPLIGCEMMLMDSVLYLDIQGCIGVCSDAQQYVEEHGGVQCCIGLHYGVGGAVHIIVHYLIE